VTVLWAHDSLRLNVSELTKCLIQNVRPIPNQKRAEANQEKEKEAKVIEGQKQPYDGQERLFFDRSRAGSNVTSKKESDKQAVSFL